MVDLLHLRTEVLEHFCRLPSPSEMSRMAASRFHRQPALAPVQSLMILATAFGPAGRDAARLLQLFLNGDGPPPSPPSSAISP